MEKGPGPQVWASSPGGGRNSSTMSLAIDSQGLSARPRHTMWTMRPPGRKAFAHVAKPRDGIGEEHGAEAREDEVELGLGQRDLGIAAHQGDVGQAAGLDVLAGVVEEGVAAVDADDVAFRADAPGQLHGGVAEAAADIEHAVAGIDRQRGEHRLAVLGEPVDEDMLEADELRRQDLVPEPDELGVRRGRAVGVCASTLMSLSRFEFARRRWPNDRRLARECLRETWRYRAETRKWGRIGRKEVSGADLGNIERRGLVDLVDPVAEQQVGVAAPAVFRRAAGSSPGK
jgi:hypothetical protein